MVAERGKLKGAGQLRGTYSGAVFLHCAFDTVVNVYDGWISSPLARHKDDNLLADFSPLFFYPFLLLTEFAGLSVQV